MRKVIIAAALAAPTIPAIAQIPSEADRTVSWYMHHQDALNRVTTACMNDPGHGHNNPDCINAEQARIGLADADARHHAGLDGPPRTDPAYWVQHPADLKFELHICAVVPANSVATTNCPAARAAASRLAGR